MGKRMPDPSDYDVSRRDVLIGTAAAAAISSAPKAVHAQTIATLAATATQAPSMMTVSFSVNGVIRELSTYDDASNLAIL
jgi:xanthine dehydrogenase YagT iron-sulfur-binding subunit